MFLRIIFIIFFTNFIFANNKNRDFYLNLLKINQSKLSLDYVNTKKDYQLHQLITEKSNPKTEFLSYDAKSNSLKATLKLLSVDQEISNKIINLQNDKNTYNNILQAISSIMLNIENGNKIYIYGTGSTGRLAKQIENIWYSFWVNLKNSDNWHNIKNNLNNIKNINDIEHLVIGEITGGDRALISSLEGFEDLKLMGKLQLIDNKINANDIVFAVTEGGETSAVIGAIEYASSLKSNNSNKLYFVYNNPDEILKNYTRSNNVLLNDNISKINFTTGSQAIMGSTRMQATTSQTYLIANIIQTALYQVLKKNLNDAQLLKIGFNKNMLDINYNLNQFINLQKSIMSYAKLINKIALNEYNSYLNSSKTYYYADNLLTTLFIDVTERSPTFNLIPIDTINNNKSWINVYTNANNIDEWWVKLLNRDFKGLNYDNYIKEFESNISDIYLRKIANKSISNATYNQKFLYDYSINSFLQKKLLIKDYFVTYLLLDEFNDDINNKNFLLWLNKLQKKKNSIVIIGLKKDSYKIFKIKQKINKLKSNIDINFILLPIINDPMQINQKIATKIILNTQSTLIMAKLERVLGNSMLYVYPSNLKLNGRATFLLQTHLNRIIDNSSILSNYPHINYNQANAILIDTSDYLVKNNQKNDVAVIPLALVRIIQSLLHKENDINYCIQILKKYTLSEYISNFILINN
jgi:N-acetylmuramic acid 6-phosphate etherase